ncbi:MAG TPA: BON domain-containing protein [Acidimicrobiales bacterium]
MSESREPEHYAGERLRDALAADPRVSELSVQVHIVADHVFVTGQVPTQERVDAISEIAARVLPDHVLHNDLGVITLAEPPTVEHLP